LFDPQVIEATLRAPPDPWLARVEDAGLNASQPREQLLLDGWLLRFSPGKARRARSVNAVAAGTMPVAEKLALCRRWYARLRLPLLVRITPFSQPPRLDEALAGVGFVAFDDTRVMTCAIDGGAPPADGLRVCEVDPSGFAAAVGRLRDSPPEKIAAHRERLLHFPLHGSTARLVAVDAEGAPLAAGQVLVEDDLAGLYDIVVAENTRRRGYGRALSRRLLAAAAAMGARTAYLQVDAGNAPARRIYSSLGFVDRYAYWYRQPAGADAAIVAQGDGEK
jgi:ribosomal protein S18 acetylase RimI-like enzyme